MAEGIVGTDRIQPKQCAPLHRSIDLFQQYDCPRYDHTAEQRIVKKVSHPQALGLAESDPWYQEIIFAQLHRVDVERINRRQK